MRIQEHVALRTLATLRTGGEARYVARVRSLEDLKEAVRFARKNGLPFFALGGGSNVLPSDRGFPGLIAKIELKGIEFRPGTKGAVSAVAAAGELWDGFVAETVGEGLYGLENLSGIPGTVGGAPVQNIGAYGAEVGDAVLWVTTFDTETLRPKKFRREDCRFGYRSSFFQTPEGRKHVITEVGFRLVSNGAPRTGYADIARALAERGGEATPGGIRELVLAIRAKKFPDLRTTGTAGSFFKNPIVPAGKFDELKRQFPLLPGYPAEDGRVKLSLAWILDKACGLKGFRRGAVALYENQPLVLVNEGGAAAGEIAAFAGEVAGRVKEKTGIEIEWEVRTLP